ncbi:MAG: hypothetical protein QME47_06915 [Candidatus Thermoplasmatota archaeon]|nr:hypothetical protein [Candidatus Thermoplasmatota archaeon]
MGGKEIESDVDVEDFLAQEGVTKSIYALTARRKCWKCGQKTTVIGFFFMTGNTVYDVFNITKCPDELVKMIKEKFPFWKKSYSKTAKESYYANHCENCGALQGDYFLHNEPGEPFFGIDYPCLSQIAQHIPLEKYTFSGALDCSIGMSAGLDPQEWMKNFI